MGFTAHEQATCDCRYYYSKEYPNGKVIIWKNSKCIDQGKERASHCIPEIEFRPFKGKGEVRKERMTFPKSIEALNEILQEWGVG